MTKNIVEEICNTYPEPAAPANKFGGKTAHTATATPPVSSLVDTKLAAEHLGNLKPNTLEGWRTQGVGPQYVKIGRLVRYKIESLDKWLEAQTRSSTSDAEVV